MRSQFLFNENKKINEEKKKRNKKLYFLLILTGLIDFLSITLKYMSYKLEMMKNFLEGLSIISSFIRVIYFVVLSIFLIKKKFIGIKYYQLLLF